MKRLLFLFVAVAISSTAFCNDIFVKDAAELKAANKNAKPGDNIILADGVWKDVKIELTCKGTAMAPIRVRAAHNGKVSIEGKSYLRLGGDYIIVEGLVFTNGAAANGNVWDFKANKSYANNCRITQCKIDGFNNADKFDDNYWIAFYGNQNRLDHNTFLNKTNIGVLLAVVLDDDKCRQNDHSIDSNYFGLRKPLGSNGGEMIRIGVSQHCEFYSNTVVRDNLFENCDGETEIISIKSCGNTIRNNVFKECQGAVVLRHGNNNTIEGNVFLGNNKEGTGGVRVINEGNWVVNNFFSNCRGVNFRSPLSVMNGVFNSPANRYVPVRDAVIANNTFFNSTPITLGEGADLERSVEPKNVYIFNNIFYNDVDKEVLLTYSPVDSVFISQNLISKKYDMPALAGFATEYIRLQKFADKFVPTTVTKFDNNPMPLWMKKLQASRLSTPINMTAGVTDFKAMEKRVAAAASMGMMPTGQMQKENAYKKVECNSFESLRDALAKEMPMVITLTGNRYDFTEPAVVKGNKTIIGRGKITFSSKENIEAAFVLSENANLVIRNTFTKCEGLGVGNFILAPSKGNTIHTNVNITKSTFIGLIAKSFLALEKGSYADKILVKDCKFINTEADLFLLQNESDDKGYYNVEEMHIEKCTIENHKGIIANLYRGGSDESTMGPKFFFTGNLILDAQSAAPLIRLYGVQYSLLQNNIFKNSNTDGTIVIYEDKVRGDHEQQYNSIIGSGKIIENKFVTNLK